MDNFFFFFFFQAEDGIRDFHVTGVQTCALPIYCETMADRTEVYGFGSWARARIAMVLEQSFALRQAVKRRCRCCAAARATSRRVKRSSHSGWEAGCRPMPWRSGGRAGKLTGYRM